jgi:transposase
MTKYTFKQFQTEFPDDAACLAKLMEIKWGGTDLSCPGCGVRSKFHAMGKRRGFACQSCGHHIFPCVGTIFEKSSTPLTKWFFAMYLMTSTRHGVAAKELERQLGVTYKTAWRMAHELRKLMASADERRPLVGHVEIDETYIGGKQRRSEQRKKGTNKTVVMGLVERDGIVRAAPIEALNMSTVIPYVTRNVHYGSTITTDESSIYNAVPRTWYEHGRVDHSKEEYVRGKHHTNTIEGHWSRLKCSIKGTHVHVSSKHLWKYVSEFSFRRNFRASHEGMFNRLVACFALPRLAET